RQIEDDIITNDDITKFLDEHLDDDLKAVYAKQKDVDLAVENSRYRFRVNAYNTLDGQAMVLRKIETEVPQIEQLGLPQPVMDATNHKNGLVLVTGPTGSGKSTTLASMINRINRERAENIITIEDPVEFIHKGEKSIISQREVGRDAASFTGALKASLREDPDVILVGELRDLETVSLALTAAETGHLVFGTLHTNGAPNTINRILDVFPPEQQAQARSQLSQSLRLVVTQRLIKKNGGGRCAAFEVMLCSVAIANLIREGKIFQITHSMQTGKGMGMCTMEDSIKGLLSQGLISIDEVRDVFPEEEYPNGVPGAMPPAGFVNAAPTPAINPAPAPEVTAPVNTEGVAPLNPDGSSVVPPPPVGGNPEGV
ncbi:PilT/PilU family type 4a pilus ATPase, partial [Rickettsiales bacterium]|nr:PilT/PilU family type 4a pilus ATPase [Rickettsiales bacterium]